MYNKILFLQDFVVCMGRQQVYTAEDSYSLNYRSRAEG